MNLDKLKFRAWDKNNNEMFEVMGWDLNVNEIYSEVDSRGLSMCEVMQYTEIKDINGTEIYEGDIVFYDKGIRDRYGIVEFDDSGAYADGKDGLIIDLDECRVVGNIYINQDLYKNVREIAELYIYKSSNNDLYICEKEQKYINDGDKLYYYIEDISDTYDIDYLIYQMLADGYTDYIFKFFNSEMSEYIGIDSVEFHLDKFIDTLSRANNYIKENELIIKEKDSKYKTLYVVTYDGYKDSWGAEIMLKGVYSSKEKADEAIKKSSKDYLEINKIEVDKDIDTYLGGYIE